MKFAEGNKIKCFQDFKYTYGVPHNVEFEIIAVGERYMEVRGPGYGANPAGKGPLTVFFATQGHQRGRAKKNAGNSNPAPSA